MSNTAIIFVLVFFLTLLSGCSSTSKDTRDKSNVTRPTTEKAVDSHAPQVEDLSPEVFANHNDEEPLSIRLVKSSQVASEALQELDRQFDTLTITEFKLKKHSLHRIEFDNSVLFQSDKSDVSSVSINDLRSFAEVYNSNEIGKNIFILGHTDGQGKESYNQSLSLRRAIVVASILTNAGIQNELIKVVPAGEVLPKATNQTKDGRRLNRRVEILTADSRELVKSYLRQIDCSDVDKSCKQALLPIYTVKKEKNKVLVEPVTRELVTTQTPELNDLNVLEDGMTNSLNDIDAKFELQTEEQRLKISGIDVRDLFNLPTQIRNVLNIVTDVRSPLKLSKEYYYEK